ncbi:hypothetical protein AALP_AA4G029300 [Arabis alpina]|uniref:non-specific serine/threonine protein kinase n=1 Tax=Arabis alpina TaxID=50452 RepID=A0A087H0S9_ARAAL|nr:hypothetical protein AALP_AA4G029300 [Arabis alpina]
MKCRSLLGNRLTGPIPKEIGNIETLTSLVLEANQLSGELPSELGTLPNIQQIILSSNNFNGKIPTTFSKLTTLRDFRVSDNPLTGSIPNFIQNWTKLERLFIQASGLVGPIPDSIATLKDLKDFYNVNLHFAEIMFMGNSTYQSLGRRFFDIYIQRRLAVKDFNIAEEAKGVGNVVIRTFSVDITDGKLEIQLYWSGKGTTVIPKEDVYGPLISAISVDPNFNSPSRSGMSKYAHTAVVIVNLLIVFILLLLCKKGYPRSKTQMEKEFKSLEPMSSFTLKQIKTATNNFDIANRIGEGGFGHVYKGKLSNGTIIAVKQLSKVSKQGNREFLNEIGMISALHHPNLVKLYGCCVEGDQLLLLYEFVENNSLARALFGPQESQVRLDWPTRRKICIGVARGLAFLHEESRLKIVHRDIKATNVLLDKELNPKISDFGLARLNEGENTHISTRIAGTYGYMAPEYAMRGHLTDKVDVYSFGIVALEVEVLREQNNLLELVDMRLGSDYNREEAMTMIQVAILCTSPDPRDRPSMSEVVNMLEGTKNVEMEKLEEASLHRETKRLENMKRYYEIIGTEMSTSMSMTMSDQSTSSEH